MHLPDTLLNPGVVVATSVIGAAGLAYGLRAVERQLGDRTTSMMGMMAAFVFAAQMVNFPVGPGVSGHLLGGVLAAVMLGPWAGAVVIAAVLIVQCFLFADGGLTALGANFVNMGLIGSVGGHAIYAPIRRAIGGRSGILIGAMSASWFAVLLASAACALELSISISRRDYFRLLGWMSLVHAFIGLGEAVITGMVVRFVLQTRPDLIADGPSPAAGEGDEPRSTTAPSHRRWLPTMLAGLAISLSVAAFLSPLASEYPDGLEFVGVKLGVLPGDEQGAVARGSPLPAPMPDYQLSPPAFASVGMATAAAGLVGTLAVFAVAWSLGRVFAGADRERIAAHAE